MTDFDANIVETTDVTTPGDIWGGTHLATKVLASTVSEKFCNRVFDLELDDYVT